jgi:hypothetical protein
LVIQQSDETLDRLFVHAVDELERLGTLQPRTQLTLIDMSAPVRRLVLDEQPLVRHAKRRCKIPLIVLIPEPISGNPRFNEKLSIHTLIMKYAPEISQSNYPGGKKAYFHCPYSMDEYIVQPHMVLPINRDGGIQGRKITPKEMIKLFANKLGGIHADINLRDSESLEAETLFLINESISIQGEKTLFQQFGVICERIWRACAPLRDELNHD